jgi:tricarballylate dehydrogenase
VGWDVIVVGAGNAGLSAAHAARERGSQVLVLEKADPKW